MELPFAHLVCGDVILSRAWRRLDPDQANIGPRSTDRVSGGWMSTRLHMCPDLVLIYREPDDSTLERVRLGVHSELEL